jgi:hypothetical protein
MTVKAVNNTVSPNGLVLILLVFRAFLQIIKLDAPALLIVERTIVI